MSEYWKSVPRKFCDFCKCWITDNKPSIEFHERGKRHKENVEKKLKEIQKRSLKDSREKETLDEQMAQMEKAALEAFKKDLKDNPALAAQYGVSLDPKPAAKSEADEKEEESGSSSTNKAKKRKATKKKKEWYEAVTPEGYSYYWSTVTGESTWTAPEEYVSVVEQAEEENAEKESSEKESTTKSETGQSSAEDSSAVVEAVPQISEPVINARTGFGGWEVVREEQRPVLYDETSAPPELDEIPLPSAFPDVSSEPAPPKPKFKEKTVASLGTSQSGPVAFKKRKVASGARNARQRMDND